LDKGVLTFARNNSQVDYIKQAVFLAKRVRKYLDLPTTIATDSVDYLATAYPDYEDIFDQVIELDWTNTHSLKRFYDGSISEKRLEFKNDSRCLAYDISPYDETILLDSDYIISDDTFKHCFLQELDLLIYKDAYDLANFRDYSEFEYVSDTSVDFYWATCVFFRKTKTNKIFFDLIKHIQENWSYYNAVYQINSVTYRNDHAFSVAIHIMNGYQSGNFAGYMPGKLYYTTDRDILLDLQDERFTFLVEKQHHLGEYLAIKFENYSVHVMNKFSLERIINV
jgi:hypothetical protein